MSRPRINGRRLALRWNAVLVGLVSLAPISPLTAQDVLVPPGLDFPHVVAPACPGEGCIFGMWLACESLPVFESPDLGGPELGRVPAGTWFEVTSGAVVVETPGVVVVTRPVARVPSLFAVDSLFPNDTLYVLDYIGEGFFNVLRADSIVEVEVFWPWQPLRVGPDFQYGGRIVQDGRSEFWVQTSLPDEATGWIPAERFSIAALSGLDPDPPTCPVR